ncbi:MAG: phage tail length tape measure family protein [Burkholderiaceae bacterium]|jgi:phage-related minor tail protein|nr:phage tail length tape measure family protein [Burkholderiaceae bacterium]
MADIPPVNIKITVDAASARKDVGALRDDLADLGGAGAKGGNDARGALERLSEALAKAKTNAERMAVAQSALGDLLKSGAISQGEYNKRLADLAERFGVAGEAAGQAAGAVRGVVAVAGSAGAVIGGLVAALGAAALAYKQGSDEADAYRKALIMTGNAAGTTSDQLAGMAARIGASSQATQGDAAAVLAQLASTGDVAADKLQKVTQTALDLERYAGQSVDKTVQQFAALGEAPVQASLKLNEQYHYLTLAVYEQIKALEEQGRKEDAAAVAQDAYSAEMDKRTAKLKENLGAIESAWNVVKDAAKNTWDVMLGVGRETTDIDRLRELGTQLAYEETRVGGIFGPSDETRRKNISALQQQIVGLANIVGAQEDAARADAERQKVTEAGISLSQKVERSASAEVKRMKELAAAKAELDKVLDSPVATAADKARAQANYDQYAANLNKPRGRSARGPSARSEASTATAQIKADLDRLQAAIKEGDAIVVQALEDGQVSIEAAYQARLANIKNDTQAQRQAIEAQIAEIDKALAKARPGERGALAQERIKLQAELDLLDSSLQQGTRKLDKWKVDEERKLSNITAQLKVEVASITGHFDREEVLKQIQARLEPYYKAAGRQTDPAEEARQRASIDLLGQATLAQAEFNAKLEEARRIQSALRMQEEAIQVLRQKGAISQTEADSRLARVSSDSASAMSDIAQQMAAIKGNLPKGADALFADMGVSIGRLQNAADAATPSMVGLGTQIKNSLVDNLADAAAVAVTDFKNLGDFVASTLRQIAGDIMRSGIKRLLADQFDVSDGAGGSKRTNIFGALFSGIGSLFGFAEGGHVRGPGSATSDSIPALVGGRMPIRVSDGEFIQPTRAVKHYGLDFMEAIRTLQLPKPRFNFGGLVQAHQSAQRAQRTRYATGGAVTGAASAQPPAITIRMNNTGTAKEASDPKMTREGGRWVIDVLLEDAHSGGRGIRGIRSALQRG